MARLICRACGYDGPFRDRDGPACDCPPVERDYGVPRSGSVTGRFREPIEMHSVGMMPNEEPAFRRACPGIEVRDGAPVVHTRADKRRVLKYFGYQENN